VAAEYLAGQPAVDTAPDGYTSPGILDALAPPDMARKAVEVGISKMALNAGTSLVLSILAGAFVALGARGFLSNLIPVTLGNIVGGALLVAAMYWLAYLRPRHATELSYTAMQEDRPWLI
jgi:formate/nitrite transporter FocA (FNT family)